MVFAVGDTVMLLPVPADVPPQEPVNHCAVAPVPAMPPDTVKVVLPPEQIVVLPEMPVGATDGVEFTNIVMLAQDVALHSPL